MFGLSDDDDDDDDDNNDSTFVTGLLHSVRALNALLLLPVSVFTL